MIDHTASILVVDDIPANIGLLLETLQSSGFDVRVAENGLAALEQVAYEPPDLVLLDIQMPGIDGYETCRRLKANPETRPIPILFLSALNDTMDKVRGFQVGGADYVTKPIEIEEMLARVNTHLTIAQLRQQLSKKNADLEQLVSERTMALAQANATLQAEVNRRRREEKARDTAVTLAQSLTTQLQSTHTVPASAHDNDVGELLSTLSEREMDVLKRLTSGETNAEIAQTLGITEATVRTYRLRIMNKLDIYHLPGLTRLALLHHLIV